MRIKSPRDFWAGLMFLVVGVFVSAWATAHYQMGTAVRMGPAYFPAVLGGLQAVLGLIVLGGSFAVEGPKVERFYFRPLAMITLACVLYGYAMKPLGLVGATAVLVYVAALGGHEFNWKEVTILYVALIVMSVLVFVKALAMPFQLWPEALS